MLTAADRQELIVENENVFRSVLCFIHQHQASLRVSDESQMRSVFNQATRHPTVLLIMPTVRLPAGSD